MKFFHLSDLHLGKRFNEASLMEDQEYILDRVLDAARAEKPDALLVAGDIYDKPTPPVDAVEMWDRFLLRITEICPHVFALPGNHDAAERVTQYAGFTGRAGLHLAPPYAGSMQPVTLRDEAGEVDVWQLPFVRPLAVKRFHEQAEIASFTDAVRTALAGCAFTPGRRNVLCAHQYVTGSVRSDSDVTPVGGLDNVDASVFDGFDYVALGHIHKAQNVAEDGHIRYCGAPLKYTFGECDQEKSITVVELDGAGKAAVRLIPLTPLREVRRLRGDFATLMRGAPTGDYVELTLTDEHDIPDAMRRLRAGSYPFILALQYDNSRTRALDAEEGPKEPDKKPLELFDSFFRKMTGREPSEEERTYIEKLIREIWEEDA